MGLPANSFITVIKLAIDDHAVLEPVDPIGDALVRHDCASINLDEQFTGGIRHNHHPDNGM
jgi:hypothetical protein